MHMYSTQNKILNKSLNVLFITKLKIIKTK